MTPINTEIFKAYDVRGLYPGELDEDTFQLLGRAFAAFLGPGTVAVTHDMRVSSSSLTKAFIDGAAMVRAGGVTNPAARSDRRYSATHVCVGGRQVDRVAHLRLASTTAVDCFRPLTAASGVAQPARQCGEIHLQ